MNDTTLREKSGKWLLQNAENSLKAFLVPKVPKCIETYHLTYLTLLWGSLVVLFFYLGKESSVYLYTIPLFVVLQYLTDVLDGAVGKGRNTGLVKWGYYTDHFFDYLFLITIIFGYGIVIGFSLWLFLLFAVSSAFMVHAFLLVSTNTGEGFQISAFGIGPTEGRVLYILAHTLLIYVGIHTLDMLLPYIVLFSALILLYIFILAEKNLWKKDMNNKQNNI